MYRFALEPVLTYRDNLAKALQKELSEQEKILAEEEGYLSTMVERKDAVAHGLEEAQKKGQFTVGEILLSTRYLESMENQIRFKKKRVKEVKALCLQKRLSLIEAMKRKKMVERLKVKGLHEYMQEQRSQEMKFLDEVSVIRFNERNNPGGGSLMIPEGVSG